MAEGDREGAGDRRSKVDLAALKGRAPDAEALVAALAPRRTLSGEKTCEISVRLKVVTPILGGGPKLRKLDDVDIIRVPTVRGHLRFWWRALYGHQFKEPKELYKAESTLWGRPADDNGGRSAVEVRVDVDRATVSEPDTSRVSIGSIEGYALWPAREPHADRRPPGTEFDLTVIAPEQYESTLKSTVRAWILFGGYGSRTRRGLGSLTVLGADGPNWLPDTQTSSGPRLQLGDAIRASLTALFGRNLFQSPQVSENVPHLTAALHILDPTNDAASAWNGALEALREFRQGPRGGAVGSARRPDTGRGDRRSASVSNWPEADKVRHFLPPASGLKLAHTPRFNNVPAWPRAALGLPIVGKFQNESRVVKKRDGQPVMRNGRPVHLKWHELSPSDPNYGDEPDGFELRWRSGGEVFERLASPVIVKPLALRDGRFVPCILWLSRKLPDTAEVGLWNRGAFLSGTLAPLSRLRAPDDADEVHALRGKTTLRDAFLGWLKKTKKSKEVAP